jgi:acyl phosphate:glycerol-3-phosphate acyltransferase
LFWPVALLAAFLAGSIPTGLLLARARGVDLREHGSGNIGATNVWRVLGRGPGLACFAIDAVKGFVPVLVAGWLAGVLGEARVDPSLAWWWLGTAAAAILGHMFSPWAGFRGGKGVATGFGALLGIAPLLTGPTLGAFAVWVLVAKRTGYVSIASCLSALSLPLWLALTVEFLGDGVDRHSAAVPFYIVTALLGAMVLLRHRANLARVVGGTENRIGDRPRRVETPDEPIGAEPSENPDRPA